MNPTIIAIVEGVVIFILLLLIIFRKIGRPLSETEIRQKIERKKQKQLQRQKEYEQQQFEYQKLLNEISAQEMTIKTMPRPVIYVSLAGDFLEGRTLCVQDGNGTPYALHCHDDYLDKAPLFNGLYQASIEPHYYSKRGAVLLK